MNAVKAEGVRLPDMYPTTLILYLLGRVLGLLLGLLACFSTRLSFLTFLYSPYPLIILYPVVSHLDPPVLMLTARSEVVRSNLFIRWQKERCLQLAG
jgi:hypothetical protein